MKSCFTLALHIPHSPEREEAEPPEHDVSDTDPSALAHPPAETGRTSETCWCAQVFSERFTGEISTRLWTLIGSSLGSRVTCLQVSTDTKIKLSSSIR